MIHMLAKVEGGAYVHPLATVCAFAHVCAGAEIARGAVIEVGATVGMGAHVDRWARVLAGTTLGYGKTVPTFGRYPETPARFRRSR